MTVMTTCAAFTILVVEPDASGNGGSEVNRVMALMVVAVMVAARVVGVMVVVLTGVGVKAVMAVKVVMAVLAAAWAARAEA